MVLNRGKALASAILFTTALICIYSTVAVAGTEYAPWSLWLAGTGIGFGYISAQLLTQAIGTPQHLQQKRLKKTE